MMGIHHVMELHLIIEFHNMMEFHNIMKFHNFVWFVKSLAVLTTYWYKMSLVKLLFVASIASLTPMMTSMSSTINLLQQMGIVLTLGTCSKTPRQLVPTSRMGCTTTSAAPTARRSSHCSRTPSSATTTPPWLCPSNVSVLHLQYCYKGNFPASTAEKSESVHP